MKTLLTKSFSFSASFARGAKIHGHNYVLEVMTDALSASAEAALESNIEAVLIRKIDSRDLGTDVDFLKGVEITDTNLLRAFWPILSEAVAPVALHSLTLHRDRRTRTVVSG